MTDLFFPINPPTHHELQLIELIRYKAFPPEGGKFMVHAINTDYNTLACVPFVVPSPYYEHIKRFLWRHQLFMGVEKRRDELALAVGLCKQTQCYIAYLDAIIEGLFIKARWSEFGLDWRSDLFDLYLVVDYFVHGHKYNQGALWRLNNPDQILEVIDVTTLDWETFYAASDDSDAIWSGSSYQFDITNVGEGDWQILADAAANYLGLINPQVKLQKRQRGHQRATSSNK
ncbi:hypothetical protein F5141DRAFT_1090002 [Pisolithus sp. B1]|nr:hypothetical protein F5141DRAFT_1090002 [Pisolithus sp. B1]